MRDLCTCPARHSGDYRDVRDHCTRYFLPYGWAYEEEGEHRSLILKGRCMCCGGEIWAAMPVPNCFQLGEIYYFLFQQLKTWRPYAMRGDPGEYPAANDRMAWYQLQDERSDLDYLSRGDGLAYTSLTLQQVSDLRLDLYSLDDFSLKDFKKAYHTAQSLQDASDVGNPQEV